MIGTIAVNFASSVSSFPQVDKNQAPPVTIDYNLYYCAAGPKSSTWAGASATAMGFDKYVEATGNDRHSQFVDPQFINIAANNFRLKSYSPALAAGTAEKLPVGKMDLDASPRVRSGKIDIGCYER